MIRAEKYVPALEALRAVLVQAKFMASQTGAGQIADLLNDAEMLPEYWLDEQDRTDDVQCLFSEIAQMYPGGGHILDRFDETVSVEP